jgi:hypothetical protein
VSGTLAPGVYELEFEMELEVEAQVPGNESHEDEANGDVSLVVGA